MDTLPVTIPGMTPESIPRIGAAGSSLGHSSPSVLQGQSIHTLNVRPTYRTARTVISPPITPIQIHKACCAKTPISQTLCAFARKAADPDLASLEVLLAGNKDPSKLHSAMAEINSSIWNEPSCVSSVVLTTDTRLQRALNVWGGSGVTGPETLPRTLDATCCAQYVRADMIKPIFEVRVSLATIDSPTRKHLSAYHKMALSIHTAAQKNQLSLVRTLVTENPKLINETDTVSSLYYTNTQLL
ncbi:hypothetical protein HD554DRAFT_1067801 [Boletus coccyginus]|nr:hypothetical protein HD554DRAFT_1067801 [Boletus coccyginus]